MELPDDVLWEVRKFSKPRMRFYKEYRQGLSELGFTSQEHWIELRDKLCTSDAERVFQAFLVYKQATLALRQFHKGDWSGPYSVYHTTLENLILNRTRFDRELRVVLFGEEYVMKHGQRNILAFASYPPARRRMKSVKSIL